jgi:hypothetical protein
MVDDIVAKSLPVLHIASLIGNEDLETTVCVLNGCVPEILDHDWRSVGYVLVEDFAPVPGRVSGAPEESELAGNQHDNDIHVACAGSVADIETNVGLNQGWHALEYTGTGDGWLNSVPYSNFFVAVILSQASTILNNCA